MARQIVQPLPHSWYINDWPPYVVPGNPSRGRHLVRMYQDELIACGALAQLGGARYCSAPASPCFSQSVSAALRVLKSRPIANRSHRLLLRSRRAGAAVLTRLTATQRDASKVIVHELQRIVAARDFFDWFRYSYAMGQYCLAAQSK